MSPHYNRIGTKLEANFPYTKLFNTILKRWKMLQFQVKKNNNVRICVNIVLRQLRLVISEKSACFRSALSAEFSRKFKAI